MNIDFSKYEQCETTDDKLNFIFEILKRHNNFYNKPHFTSAEVCKYLAICNKTLENYCSDGSIKYYKPNGVRYFLKEDIDNYIRERAYKNKYKAISV